MLKRQTLDSEALRSMVNSATWSEPNTQEECYIGRINWWGRASKALFEHPCGNFSDREEVIVNLGVGEQGHIRVQRIQKRRGRGKFYLLGLDSCLCACELFLESYHKNFCLN